MIEKVDSKLTLDLVTLYSQGIESEEATESRGMRVLEKLRGHVDELPLLKDVVACIHGAAGTAEATADKMLEACSKARAKGIKIGQCALRMRAERSIDELVAKEEFRQTAAYLEWKPRVDTAPASALGELSAEDAKSLQKKLVMKVILNLLRTEEMKGQPETVVTKREKAAQQLQKFLQVIDPDASPLLVKILDEDLQNELKNLVVLLMKPLATDIESEEEKKALETAKGALMTKTCTFYKHLALFSTGMYIIKKAMEAAARFELMKVHTAQHLI